MDIKISNDQLNLLIHKAIAFIEGEFVEISEGNYEIIDFEFKVHKFLEKEIKDTLLATHAELINLPEEQLKLHIENHKDILLKKVREEL